MLHMLRVCVIILYAFHYNVRYFCYSDLRIIKELFMKIGHSVLCPFNLIIFSCQDEEMKENGKEEFVF